MNGVRWATLALASALAACGVAPGSTPTSAPAGVTTRPPTAAVATSEPAIRSSPVPASTPLPTPTPQPGALNATELRYRLIDRFGAVGSDTGIFYCDPDQFPVAKSDTRERALAGFDELRKDAGSLNVILRRLGFGDAASLTDDQKVAAYAENNKLRAIVLDPAAAVGFRFALSQRLAGGGQRIDGNVSANGEITVITQTPAQLSCPICLPLGARIDTPNGSRTVETLQVGDLVWTQSARGERVAAGLTAIGQTIAPSNHRVVAVTLDDGRRVTASPGHPVRDGSPLGSLRPGDRLDGARVVDVTLLDYGDGRTFDILPSGETGVYWTDGVPLGSTLWHAR